VKRYHTFFLIRGLFLPLFLISLFFQPLLAEEVSDSSLVIANAGSCKSSLLKAPSRKTRSHWLSCIAIKKRVYYKKSSSEAIRKEAVSDLIDLYRQLGRQSGKHSDREKEKYWKKIQSNSITERGNKIEISSNLIANLRSSFQENHLRLVLDVKNLATYETHENKESQSLQVDFSNTAISPDLEKRSFFLNKEGMKAELISGNETTELSILNVPYESFRISQLPDPNRWIIDIQLSKGKTQAPPVTGQDQAVPLPKKTLEDIRPQNQGIHKIIIDPGHGGKDPGAIGLSGYSEKEAVLDIGLRLKELLVKKLKVEVLMTRSKDVFIPLGERTRMANEANADLFISIHANSSPHRNTHGIEIYLLGQSSDKRALRTAARENNVTEEEASNLDKTLLSIKKDLSQEFKKEESLELAHATRSSFLAQLRPSYPVVDLGVKTAPFYVLMNTSMPSILAEVSFISNPAEEQRLKNKSYRQIMAESLLEGIKNFIAANSNTASF
jgi:N-acetylmuramoyl-L-alanine amidase